MSSTDTYKNAWLRLLHEGISDPTRLSFDSYRDFEALQDVVRRYPMRINRYFYDLIREKGETLGRQVIPDPRELQDAAGLDDPLGEEKDSPVPHLTHRYPDRVLFVVTLECAVYCRFCTRKRKVGRGDQVTDDTIQAGLAYIAAHPEIRDVLVSGGDPLILSDAKLGRILERLRRIPHVQIIRIGTRIPGVLPQRITSGLIRTLKKAHPLFMNLHFNHPDEITDEVRSAVKKLADAGIPLGSQTVLLRGINDRPEILGPLFRELLQMRIRPYYLLQGDLAKGTDHFRTPLDTGVAILRALRGRVSGLALPTLVVDLPGGGGKVPLCPDYVARKNPDVWTFHNYLGGTYQYPEPKQYP